MQYILVVLRDPEVSMILYEVCDPSSQIILEPAGHELVRVEQVRAEDPRDNGQTHGQPKETKFVGEHARITHAADATDKDGRDDEIHSVVVSKVRVVEVEATNFLHLEAAGCGLAHKGAALGGQAATRCDIARATVTELVGDVVADKLSLKDEHDEGARHHGPDESAEGQPEAAFVPDLTEERQVRRNQEQPHQCRKPCAQEPRNHHGVRLILAEARVERPEVLLAAGCQYEEPESGQEGHAYRDEVLRHVVANVRVPEGEHFRQVQELTKAEHLARDDLLASSRREFREKAQDCIKAEVAAFGQVEVLAMLDRPPLSSQGEVHAREDVLREVQGLRRLGDTALLHHELLVHDVRVAVMHPSSEHGVATLQNSAEGNLTTRRKVADGAEIAGDMLRKPNDLPRTPAARTAGAELPEDARK
mmetsp:Transcript_109152/g.243778  ORF Transcript_109152/g.243778 Transcript_109152/m.243778 type:complete len:420 (+) Transcript_109152:946-2205(+)